MRDLRLRVCHVCPILAKFLHQEAERHANKGHVTKKLQIFKIQDSGRVPFRKSLNHHMSVKILSDF